MNCAKKEICSSPVPESTEVKVIGDGFLKTKNGCEVSSETDLSK